MTTRNQIGIGGVYVGREFFTATYDRASRTLTCRARPTALVHRYSDVTGYKTNSEPVPITEAALDPRNWPTMFPKSQVINRWKGYDYHGVGYLSATQYPGNPKLAGLIYGYESANDILFGAFYDGPIFRSGRQWSIDPRTWPDSLSEATRAAHYPNEAALARWDIENRIKPSTAIGTTRVVIGSGGWTPGNKPWITHGVTTTNFTSVGPIGISQETAFRVVVYALSLIHI